MFVLVDDNVGVGMYIGVAVVVGYVGVDVVYYVDVVMYGVTVCCVHAVVRVCVGRC